METIAEPELINNLKAKAVSKIRLVQRDDKRYEVFITVSWKGGESLLITQRKRARIWVSLDRFVKHATDKYYNIPLIEIDLRSIYERNNEQQVQQEE